MRATVNDSCYTARELLIRRIMDEAGRLKVPVLYLYTVHSETFYASLNWTLQEHADYRKQNVAIMTYRP